MHTCDPPSNALQSWLEGWFRTAPGYTHLLLQAKQPSPPDLAASLRPYFESAHADARRVFHKYAKLDLHPDAAGDGSAPQYPSSLPTTTRHGLFGEVLAGLVVQAYRPDSGHTWSVPVFLFRHHADVGKYLFHLARDPSSTRQLWGRFGDDFIGVSFGPSGGIERFIVGEAKYRKSATKLTVDDLLLGSRAQKPPKSGHFVRKDDGIWRGFKEAPPVPEGLGQLQAILVECAPDQYAEAILSLDRILAIHPQQTVPRTDLVVIAGDTPATRKSGDTNVDPNVRPQEYDAGRDLHVVEVFLHNGAGLIESLYDSLWSGGPDGTN
jgi:hypothetical protein